MGWRMYLAITIEAFQWSVSVSRDTIWPYCHGQCRYKWHKHVECGFDWRHYQGWLIKSKANVDWKYENETMFIQNGWSVLSLYLLFVAWTNTGLSSICPWWCHVAPYPLTHWSRMTQICVHNLTIIGSDNGLAPSLPQALWPSSMRPYSFPWRKRFNLGSTFVSEPDLSLAFDFHRLIIKEPTTRSCTAKL